jgi:SAM-dependent methyltransferase
MKLYAQTARFYDAVMGDRTDMAAYVRHLIVHNKPDAKTLLELACGTGALLKLLARFYTVVGLDVSPEMLSLARKKLPRASFFRQDMVSFHLGRKFDVIICVFDSINHVLRFAGWEKVFRRVALHLHEEGLFVFDINTVAKLQRRIRTPALMHAFGRNSLIMEVTDERRGIANWNIKVFEYQGRNRGRLFEENIKEAAFPVETIKRALRKHFAQIQVLDPLNPRPSVKSDRLYFVCKR